MFESLVGGASPNAGECWRLANDELLQELAGIEVLARRVYARSLELVAEAQSRDLASQVGYPSLPNLLQAVLRISRGEARQRIANTTVLSTETGRAARDGALGPEHVGVIAKALQQIAPYTSVVEQQEAERILVQAAASLDPAAVAQLGREIVARVDHDGAVPPDNDLDEPVRHFRSRTRRDGSVVFSGHLDPETGALLGAVLDPLAAPYPADAAGPDLRDMPNAMGMRSPRWCG